MEEENNIGQKIQESLQQETKNSGPKPGKVRIRMSPWTRMLLVLALVMFLIALGSLIYKYFPITKLI